MLPSIVSQLMVLLKDTAVGFLITDPELLFYARYLGSQGTFDRPMYLGRIGFNSCDLSGSNTTGAAYPGL